MNSHLRALLHSAALGALALTTYALSACTETPNGPSGDGSGFVSDLPGSQFNGSDSGSTSSSSGGGGGEAQPPKAADDDPNRAIEEADIIQVHENRLYALSQYAGLSIIDIANPSHLMLLGRHSMTGMPFEMYLRDGIVYAMFSSYWQPVYDAATQAVSWVQTSHVEALNVSDPAHIAELGQFDLPGNISDSRMVGDVLYAVSYEDGYCWDCQDKPTTTITSIGVGDPANISVIDTLSFTSPDPYGYGWWRRSIAVTTERMYVAGIEWNGDGEGHSTIQIVDISDPGGALVKGASVQAAGQIESRWQMDERDGVLRVVSQPGIWWTNGVPTVQTFTVTSSHEVAPLGALDLTLPKPERLRSVRFDQSRAYAITAEQTDPLFTIDLSDPAHPAQLGELEMPGWIYHMEPRGDRLFALGFDNSDPQGSLHVSLFDVADMTQPTMLARIPFGGQWSMLPEDQDRIHKAFKIVDDLGAIFVPYAAWKSTNDPYGCGSYESGIQIVDFTHDTLTKRGDAPATGWTRRSFLNDDKLFAVSDAEVRAYDISDRDAPAELGSLPLSINVTASHVVGSNVVRLAADWWSGQAKLDVVPKSDPARAEPLGSLDLTTLGQGSCGGIGYYGTRLFHHGTMVYLVASVYSYEGPGGQSLIAVIDVSDPSAPALRGKITLPFESYGGWWSGNIVSSGENVVQIGNALVFQKLTRSSWSSESSEQASLVVVDFTNPDEPTTSASPAPAERARPQPADHRRPAHPHLALGARRREPEQGALLPRSRAAHEPERAARAPLGKRAGLARVLRSRVGQRAHRRLHQGLAARDEGRGLLQGLRLGRAVPGRELGRPGALRRLAPDLQARLHRPGRGDAARHAPHRRRHLPEPGAPRRRSRLRLRQPRLRLGRRLRLRRLGGQQLEGARGRGDARGHAAHGDRGARSGGRRKPGGGERHHAGPRRLQPALDWRARDRGPELSHLLHQG
jgi:hypothetical protein